MTAPAIAATARATDRAGSAAVRATGRIGPAARGLEREVLVIMGAFVVVASVVAIGRLYAGRGTIIDVGVFQQALDTFLATGVPLTSINPPFQTQHWLGFHFSPIVLILAPLWWLAPVSETLLIAQAVLVGSSLWPVWLTVRRLGGSRQTALFVLAPVVCHPWMGGAVLFDFHETAFAVPALAWLAYAAVFAKVRLFWAMSVVLLLTKEHYGLSVAGAGLFWGLTHGGWRLPAAAAVVGLASLALVVGVVMPALADGTPHPMLAVADSPEDWLGRYGWISQGPAVWFVFARQWLEDPISWLWVALILGMHGRYGLLGVTLGLVGLADLATSALSASSVMRAPMSYHMAPVVPVMAMAAARGWLVLARDRSDGPGLAPLALAAAAAGLVLGAWPLPGATDVWRLREDLTLDRPQIPAAVVAAVSEPMAAGEPVAVSPEMGMFLNLGPAVCPFPLCSHQVAEGGHRWLILRLRYPYRDPDTRPVGNPYSVSIFGAALRRALADPAMGVAVWHDPWLVLSPGAPRDPGQLARIERALTAMGQGERR